jgi:predicted ATPase/DNA-binding SARP family transcriptional activator
MRREGMASRGGEVPGQIGLDRHMPKGVVEVDPLCRIELLGGLRVLQDKRAITRFRTQKAGALLAYLAYHLDHAHPREVLIELLWPWSAPAAGRRSLSVELSSLRRQLEPPGMPRGAVIKADRASVQLSAGAVTTDVADFEASLASAERASTDTERVQCLVDVVGPYGGPLLPGYYQDWILPEQERLAGLYLGAVRALTTDLANAGDHERAIEYARRAVGAERLREDTHEQLIKVLAASGQIEAALRQYAELEQVLAEELGEEPSAPVRALAEQLTALRDRSPRRGEAPLFSLVLAPPERPEGLPSGTVTLLLADVVCPGDLPGGIPEVSQDAVAELHDLLRREIDRCGGQEFNRSDHSLAVVFGRPSEGLSCAIACQQALMVHPQAEGARQLRARMALDTGEAELEGGSYRGTVVDRARGLLLAAPGGRILCSEAAASMLRTELPPDVALADLGHYRLRTMETPERLFAVEYPDVAMESFPPPKAAFAYRSNLPPQFNRFFGREEELAQLEQLLLADETRLVTLTGPGGSGKTRLAVEAAADVADAFRGAAWFVPLQELMHAELIAGAIVDALDLARSPGLEPLDQACEALSRQPSLLVLDNFEHLVSDGAAVVQSVLERALTVKCLVTSRQRLNVSAEKEFPVDPLPTPARETPPDELVHCPSAQLFVDRAQAVRPDFQVTEGNAGAIAAVCDHLEGIPLALELAAARAQVMTPARMLEQVESRFGFLVSRRRDVTERHRTLEAACDWSYALLRPELQRFFARLSVFRGGWVVEAAEAVCEEPRALEYLEQLRECSMILVDPPRHRSTDTRFRMLETLREYGWELLSAGDRDRLRDSHARYYLAYAEHAGRQVGGPQPEAGLDRLEAEHDNCRAALEWFGSSDEQNDCELRLACALEGLWRFRGHITEGLERIKAALGRVQPAPRTAIRARALRHAAAVAQDRAGSFACLEEALAIFRELGDDRGTAFVVESLSHAYGAAGLFDETQARAEEALTMFRRLGDEASAATCLYLIGYAAENRGDLPAARDLYEEVLSVRQAAGHALLAAEVMERLAGVATASGDYARARELLGELLATYRSWGTEEKALRVLDLMAVTAWSEGDFATARRLMEQVLSGRRAIGAEVDPILLRHVGCVARLQGDLRAARAFLEESAAVFVERSEENQTAMTLNHLAVAAALQGDHERARSALRGPAERAQARDPRAKAEVLEAFGVVAACEGRPQLGIELLGAADAIRQSAGAYCLPFVRYWLDRNVADARADLDDETFAAAWERGRKIDCEEAFQYVLKELGSDPSPQ